MDAPLLPDGLNRPLGEAERILDYVRGRVAERYARAALTWEDVREIDSEPRNRRKPG